MGDLANMTDSDGRVNGTRLLRWLRSRARMERERAAQLTEMGCIRVAQYRGGRADVYGELADDLERELTPPDYPEDEDDTVDLDDPALAGGPEEERRP